MDTYKDNLEILLRRFGSPFDKLDGVHPEPLVEVVPTQSGYPTFSYREPCGRKIIFHSLYGPVREAYKLVSEKDLSDVRVVVILGMGFGYHLEQVLKNPNFSGRVIVIEPSFEIFKAVLMSRDLRYVLSDTKVHFLLEPDAGKARNSIYTLPFFSTNIFKSECIYLPAYKKVFPEYYCKVLDAIDTKISRRLTDSLAIDELSKDWERNCLENLDKILSAVPITRFFNEPMFKDMPGIIVAAGPSLDKNVHELKLLKSKSLIFTVGTALKTLLNAGVKPDFVVALDASDVALRQYEGIEAEDAKGIWLLAEVSVSPKIVSKFYPRVSFYHSMGNTFVDYFFGKEVSDNMFVLSGGSVANCALDIARKFGLNPIVFAGQDLCLQSDGRSHASGTMYEKDRYNLSELKGINYMTIPGNYEDEVVTFRNFFIFLRWIENYINSHPEIKFINSTQGGARINGAELCGLEEVAGRYRGAQFDSTDFFTGILKAVPPGSRNEMFVRMKKGYRELRKLDKLLKKGLAISKEMAAVIKGDKLLAKEEEMKMSRHITGFFADLFRYETVNIISYSIQKETLSMLYLGEAGRIKEKGQSEGLLVMPDMFVKLQESSLLVQRYFAKILREEKRPGMWEFLKQRFSREKHVGSGHKG